MKEIIESFGALKSPFDARDYKLVVSATETFPETFELPKTTIKNQGNIGSCVAHASSSVIEYHHKKQHGEKVTFSTEFIYGFRDIGYHIGEGMYLRDALNTLRKYGDVTTAELKGNNDCITAMKNVSSKFNELAEKAYPNRVSTYFRVYDENAVKSALMNHGYVLVGMNWHKDVSLVDGVYTPGSNKVIGGHAIVIYGWNKKGWLCQNSWGGNWGNKGRFIIPFDFKFTEMWGVTDNITDNIKMPKRSIIRDLIYQLFNAFVNIFSSKENFNESEDE